MATTETNSITTHTMTLDEVIAILAAHFGATPDAAGIKMLLEPNGDQLNGNTRLMVTEVQLSINNNHPSMVVTKAPVEEPKESPGDGNLGLC